MSEGKSVISRSPAIAELDQLDILGSGNPTAEKSEVDISTFSARIQRRFDEQREVQKREDDGVRQRQYFLLVALSTARKILRGVSELKLGNSVVLNLVCDDFQGWPRILVSPNHAQDDLIELSNFEVTGSEKQGVVELIMRIPGTGFKEELLISKEEDLQRVTRILKRNIRLYLDQLTDEIIKPKYKASSKSKSEEIPVKSLSESQSLKDVNLFEENSGDEVLDTLPKLEEVQALDGLD